MNKRKIKIFTAFMTFGLLIEVAYPCHAVAPINLGQQNEDGSSLSLGGNTNGTAIRLRGQAAGRTCGCGPYYLEFEVIPNTQSYSGNPNYTSPGDNRNSCTQNWYGWTYINNLTPGVNYKWRVREYTSQSGARSNWVEYSSLAFTVNGSSNSTPLATAQTVNGHEDEIQTIILAGTDADGGVLTFDPVTDPEHGTIAHEYSSVLNFDGSNDYVKLPDFSFLDDMSFSAWFKIDSRNYWERIFDFGKGGQGDIFLTTMGGRTNGNLELTIHPFGQTHTINAGTTCQDGQWHHVVFTYDKGGAGMTLYIDGEVVGTNSYNTYSFSDFGSGQNFYLGKANWNDPYFDGKMDQVGLFDKALSEEEVSEIYNGGSYFNLNEHSGHYHSEDHLVGFWNMNEGSGTTLFDASGNGNNATTHNGPSWLTEGSSNIITYTPNPNYYGTDSFTFTVSDGIDTSIPATVIINLTSVNDIPEVTSTPTVDILEGSSYNYPLSIYDADGDNVTVTAPTKPDWLTINNDNSHSLDFDGNNDNVIADINTAIEEKTMSAWVKLSTTNQGGGGLVSLQTPGGGVFDAIVYNETGHGWGFGSDYFRRTNWSNVTENSTDWIYMTAVYADHDYKLYRNGELLHSTSSFHVNAFPSSSQVLVGQRHTGGGNAFLDAKIEGVEIWDKALSQEEVQLYMSSPPDGDEEGLIGYWKYDDGTGNQATDLTSNGYDGIINGAIWSTDIAYPSYVLNGVPEQSDGGLHDIVLNIDDGNGGVVTQSFSIAVAVTHLDITGESGFRILSSPVSGAIFGDLLEELWTQGSDGSDHEGADPNVWTYDDGWVPVADLYNDELQAGQGFVVYVFADTDFDGDDDLPVTLNVDGTINETGVSVTANPTKWNLVGNPYGLHVNINQMLSDNSSKFQSTVYRLDDSNPGYRTHNGTVGDIDQGLIKPFDGFWVQAGSNGDTFEFTEQSIRKGSISISGGGRSTTNESTGTATFTFTNGQFTSNVYLSFTENGEINLDPADAKQIIPMSPAQHLTSMIHESGKSLSINNLPSDLTTDISFDLDVMLLSPNDEGYETQSEQVAMTWDISNLPEDISLSLINNATGQTVNLYGYPSMNVTLPSKGGFSFPENLMETYPQVGESQFTLSVYTDIASNEDENIIVPEDITLHNAYPNPFNPSTVISFDIVEMNDVSLKIFDLTGRQVASLINEFMIPGNHEISWNPGQLPSGVYLVELVVGDRSFNQKITYIK